MAEFQGPPRKTTTYNDFSTMASQNERYNTKQDEFFWLENIMRVAPHKLHSVPGPGRTTFFPRPVPPVCNDDTIRGQQPLEILDYFQQNGIGDRTSWGHIGDNEEVYAIAGVASCGGGNMPLIPLCVKVDHFVGGGGPVDQPPLGHTTPSGTFINVYIGTSDRVVWAATSNAYDGMRMIFDNAGAAVDYEYIGVIGASTAYSFTVRDNTVWIFTRKQSTGDMYLFEYDRLTGTQLFQGVIFGPTQPLSIFNSQATDDFLYCTANFPSEQKILKIDIATHAVVDSVDTTALLPQFIAVANDNLIYLLCGGTQAKMYYLENFTDLTYVGYTPGQGFTPFGFGTGIWKNGAIYYGSTGFAGFGIDIFKIAIDCPPDDIPVIASVETDPTVAAGGTLNVDWADILVPVNTDRIYIKPEPPAATFGLVGATIATFINAAADSSGTTGVVIPGGTPPGSYVAMYAALGTVWVATSAPFTVT